MPINNRSSTIDIERIEKEMQDVDQFYKNVTYTTESNLKKLEESELGLKAKEEGWWYEFRKIAKEIIKLRAFFILHSQKPHLKVDIGFDCGLYKYKGKPLAEYIKRGDFKINAIREGKISLGFPSEIIEQAKRKYLLNNQYINQEFLNEIKKIKNNELVK